MHLLSWFAKFLPLRWFENKYLTRATATAATQPFFIQGHRGARGLLPENTLPGFIYALQAGVNWLELDVVISADKEVVVSHEAWMAYHFNSHPDGRRVTPRESKRLNLYKMTYQQISQFDVGQRGHLDFSHQKPYPARKPLLRQVLATCDAWCLQNNRPLPHYNIEIKSSPATEGKYPPPPTEFARLVAQIIAQSEAAPRCLVQSFDFSVLIALNKINPHQRLGLLFTYPQKLWKTLTQLPFKPYSVAIYYPFIVKTMVQNLQKRAILCFAWTVNNPRTAKHLRQMGVNSLITDYPDKIQEACHLIKHNK